MFKSTKNQLDKNKGMTNPINVKSIPGPKPNTGVATQCKVQEDLKKVNILIKLIYDVMKIYGYGEERFKSDEFRKKHSDDVDRLRNDFTAYTKANGIGSWKDLFKYKINAFFSFVMEQEVPPLPPGIDSFPNLKDPSFIAYGRGKRFIRLLKFNERKLESFAQSFAQSKKGAPPVSHEMVEEAEMKTFIHLTTPRKDIDSFVIFDGVFEHPINRDTACYQLRRTVREIFRNKIPTWDELTRPFVPSTSSQYNMDRSNAGAVGAFKNNERINEILHSDELLLLKKEGKLIRKSLGPVQLKKELTELYGKAGVVDQERIDNDLENLVVKGSIGLHFDDSELCKLWKNRIYPALIQEALEEEPRTIVIGLPEPLKVRCITAGPPLTYTVLKPMQKWLWRTLKDLPNFKLIGTPESVDIVKNQLGELLAGREFISGDYKASTDNLHSWVSECLLDELCCMWEENGNVDFPIDKFRTLMRRALTGHELLNPAYNANYRKGDHIPDKYFVPQKEGQLMGSIISFPFLCLANAAMCRWAMEISDIKNYSLIGKRRFHEECPLLINGDDCVFHGPIDNIFNNWKRITAFVGLESSVGKTFRSRKFLTINSRQYSYKMSCGWEDYSGLSEEPYEYEEIKYVNFGLIYGQKKDGIRGKPFYRLGALHRDLFRTCPPEYFKKASKLFIESNSVKRYIEFRNDKGEITEKVEDFFADMRNSHVPYYVPEWLGGLGLVPTKPKHVNEWDRKICSFLRANMSGEMRPSKLSEESNYAFHSLVDEYLSDYLFLSDQNFKEVEYDGTTRVLSQEFQKLYTSTVVEILLCESLDERIRPLIKTAKRKNEIKARRNATIWEHLRHNPSVGCIINRESQIDLEDLISEKKEFSLCCFDVRPSAIEDLETSNIKEFHRYLNIDDTKTIPIEQPIVGPVYGSPDDFAKYLASLEDDESVDGVATLYE